MNTLEAIAKAEFVATDAQVEQLAGIAADGRQAGGTYLKVLVAHVRAALAGKRKPTRAQQRTAVDEVHKRFYEHVMKGVGPADLPQAERNRRSTFSRTAASTLRHYANRGGDIRALEPADVSKAKLRGRTRVPAGTRTERTLTRSADTFVRLAKRIAQGDPVAARKRIALMQSQLTKLLFELGDNKKSAKLAKAKESRKATPKPTPVKKVPRTIRPFVPRGQAELRA